MKRNPVFMWDSIPLCILIRNKTNYSLFRFLNYTSESHLLFQAIYWLHINQSQTFCYQARQGKMSSKWIKINVGGQVFETSLQTVTKFPESKLAKMFSSETGDEDVMMTKETKDFYLDLDPQSFSSVLTWLRWDSTVLYGQLGGHIYFKSIPFL